MRNERRFFGDSEGRFIRNIQGLLPAREFTPMHSRPKISGADPEWTKEKSTGQRLMDELDDWTNFGVKTIRWRSTHHSHQSYTVISSQHKSVAYDGGLWNADGANGDREKG